MSTSRRAAIVEEEFDDDTDLPLPSLPNTGTKGPLLQELHISDDEFEVPRAGPASLPRSSTQQQQARPPQPDANRQITDITPYKSWTCIYPIYLDAKRPYGTGQRRVARARGVWWPLSKDIAEAASRLGLATLHEVNKSHPRDWENPGRVRVQWKKDGRLVNPAIKNKKQLLEMICLQLQVLKPEIVPRPPYSTTPAPQLLPPPTAPTTPSASPPLAINAPPAPAPAPAAPGKDKGKQPLSKSKSPSAAPSAAPATGGRHLPAPPTPHPPLAERISPYSPVISNGVLIETVKAGMNAAAAEPGPGAPGAGAGPQGAMAGKGKRKVLRVRG